MSQLLSAIRDNLTSIISDDPAVIPAVEGRVLNKTFTDGYFTIPVNNFKPSDDRLVSITDWELLVTRKNVTLFVKKFNITKKTFEPVQYYAPCSINHNAGILDLIHFFSYKKVMDRYHSDIKVVDYVNLLNEAPIKEEAKIDVSTPIVKRPGSRARSSQASKKKEENRIKKMVEKEKLDNFTNVDLHVLSTVLK